MRSSRRIPRRSSEAKRAYAAQKDGMAALTASVRMIGRMFAIRDNSIMNVISSSPMHDIVVQKIIKEWCCDCLLTKIAVDIQSLEHVIETLGRERSPGVDGAEQGDEHRQMERHVMVGLDLGSFVKSFDSIKVLLQQLISQGHVIPANLPVSESRDGFYQVEKVHEHIEAPPTLKPPRTDQSHG